MSNSNAVAGAPVQITLEGVQYLVRPLTVKESIGLFATLRNHFKSKSKPLFGLMNARFMEAAKDKQGVHPDLASAVAREISRAESGNDGIANLSEADLCEMMLIDPEYTALALSYYMQTSGNKEFTFEDAKRIIDSPGGDEAVNAMLSMVSALSEHPEKN